MWSGCSPRPTRRPLDRLPAKIAAVVFDFDGVFTDNRVFLSEEGIESVACNRSDGLGIGLLKKTGLPILVLSKEKVPIAAKRCEKLGLECHYGIDEKLTRLKEWLTAHSAPLENTIYMGNDVNDAECLSAVGCGVVPRDAHRDVLPLAKIVLRLPGGHGAVRELCDLVCRRQRQSSV